ncbi:MAG: aldo/keto reductase [Burkholderiales bacterium]|nr:aldo/keto reductase [Burkholderiales bacterium]
MDRRRALGFLAGVAAGLPRLGLAQSAPLARTVPASGEKLPPIGLGTWLTFDVTSAADRAARSEVMRAFFDAGGRLVDSSPMYGASEETIGAALPPNGKAMFSATKVWTVGALAGRRQLENSYRLWKLQRFDLLQVHNFLDYETHLATLKRMKGEGRVRYIGVTTSHGRRHDLAEKIMREDPIDFIQFTYNLNDREAEERLLPMAAERRIAVIINRPFDGGNLFGARTRKPLPGWAAEIGCASWAEAFLKWIVAHPAVTCAIPATAQVAHVRENMRALSGPLPDAAMRKRIAEDYARA